MSIRNVYVRQDKTWKYNRVKRTEIFDNALKYEVCAIVTNSAGYLPNFYRGVGEYSNGKQIQYSIPMLDKIYLSSGIRGVALYCSREYFIGFVKAYNGEIIMINEYPFKYIVRKAAKT